MRDDLNSRLFFDISSCMMGAGLCLPASSFPLSPPPSNCLKNNSVYGHLFLRFCRYFFVDVERIVFIQSVYSDWQSGKGNELRMSSDKIVNCYCIFCGSNRAL
uniref:Secreted protein n=1 Tax=Ascaris lumbricoides TaxID=6252 RepID=A0A0M3IER2_ASCLU